MAISWISFAGCHHGANHVPLPCTPADLGASLDKFKVPKKEKDELIAVVASTTSTAPA